MRGAKIDKFFLKGLYLPTFPDNESNLQKKMFMLSSTNQLTQFD